MRTGWLIPWLLLPAGCVRQADRAVQKPMPHIESVIPEKVLAGASFNRMPDGSEAISLTGRNLEKGAKVRLGPHRLDTSTGNGTVLSAVVPPELYARDSIHVVQVELPDGRFSNVVPWIVLKADGPPPRIGQLFPPETRAGQPFNEQPGRRAALGLTGENFVPGSKIIFGGVELETNFGDVDRLSTLVPSELFERPGEVRVQVRNPGGKESGVAVFSVKP
ncbi:MAG: hypothetical protein FJW40_12790 [Acidobacteria bacterium]|nr:hypothetical protein [Acidobacteriota bacterium]